MTGLLESGVRKPFICLGPTTEVSAHSAGSEDVSRIWPFNATYQRTLEYALLLVRFGLWRGTIHEPQIIVGDGGHERMGRRQDTGSLGSRLQLKLISV